MNEGTSTIDAAIERVEERCLPGGDIRAAHAFAAEHRARLAHCPKRGWLDRASGATLPIRVGLVIPDEVSRLAEATALRLFREGRAPASIQTRRRMLDMVLLAKIHLAVDGVAP